MIVFSCLLAMASPASDSSIIDKTVQNPVQEDRLVAKSSEKPQTEKKDPEVSYIYVGPPNASEQKQLDTPLRAGGIQGLILVDHKTTMDRLKAEEIRGVFIDQSLQVPGSSEALQKKLEPYLHSKLNRRELLLIRNEILQYYKSHDQRMVAVEIPEQDITSGVVTFVMIQAELGEVSYRGNHWFSQNQVERKLDLKKGQALDEDTLLNRLAWLNENPFHYFQAVLSPGAKKGESNLEIVTHDRFPLRGYIGGDNTGLESTGRSRYYAGVTWGNAFFLDDLLTYQYTMNWHYSRFHSHFLSYTSFLPWEHILEVYGAYAKIHPDVSDFDSSGKQAQASFRYRIPFHPLYTLFQHEVFFGFDYKYVTSDLFFVGQTDVPQQTNSQANVTQEVLGYQLEYTPRHHEVTFKVELFGSPAKWIPHQSSHDYSQLREGAKPRYLYATVAVGDIFTFSSRDSVALLVRAQGSTNRLLPSEQFTLGGYNTVRGYEESVFISDNGVCVNLEGRARPLTFFKKLKDELTFLAFIDYGWGYNYKAFDGIKKTAMLAGIGPGVRYTINPYLNVRVDYGFKLHHVKFDNNDLGKWHVAVTASY